MEITKQNEDGRIIISPVGRVDSITSVELDGALKFSGNENVVLDLSGVPYMSSAGLRCLLNAQKLMISGGGSFTIRGVQAAVRSVLDMTGFSSILTIE